MELKTYNPELIKKAEYVFLTKRDLLTPEEVESKLKLLKKVNKNVSAISVVEDEGLDPVKEVLNTIAEEKNMR